jgi:hypothetical protein
MLGSFVGSMLEQLQYSLVGLWNLHSKIADLAAFHVGFNGGSSER